VIVQYGIVLRKTIMSQVLSQDTMGMGGSRSSRRSTLIAAEHRIVTKFNDGYMSIKKTQFRSGPNTLETKPEEDILEGLSSNTGVACYFPSGKEKTCEGIPMFIGG
jgi:hypothetical protein